MYETYKSNPDFEAYFIIWQNDAFQPPDAAFCERTRRQYGLTMPVLIWQDAMLPEQLALDQRHVHLVMERGAKIVHRAQFNDRTFRPVIEELLAR